MRPNRLVFGSGAEAKDWLVRSGFAYVTAIEGWVKGSEIAYMVKDRDAVKVEYWEQT